MTAAIGCTQAWHSHAIAYQYEREVQHSLPANRCWRLGELQAVCGVRAAPQITPSWLGA